MSSPFTPPSNVRYISILKKNLELSQCCQQPTNATAGNKKSFRFQNRTRVYLVPDLASYSQEEHAACFATNEDGKRITSDLVKTVTTMRSGSHVDRNRDDFCVRGLEHMSSSHAAQQRKDHRDSVIHSVLDEQDDQFDGGYFDGDRLAVTSSDLSSDAAMRAAMKASSDAAVARRLNPSISKSLQATTAVASRLISNITDATAVSTRRTVLKNTLTKLLSSPELTTITSDVTPPDVAHPRGPSRTVGSQSGLYDSGKN